MSNLVNYRTFGDIKFIPRLDVAAFETVVQASGNPQAKELWPRVKHYIYSSDPSELQIGQPSEGHISSYYSWESSTTPPTPSQIEATQNLCNQHRIITTNTNLHKFSDVSFELRIASVQTTGPLNGKTLKSNDGIQLTFAYGLYSKELNNVSDALRQAAKYCGSNKRAEMLQHYVASFDTGDIEEHKKGSQVWVTDVGPTVESYIGFIEAYVDPTNARAEWEGFCSIVNRDLSRKFTNLVDQAPHLIKCLPWGPDWEVETFQRPDYTALEIVNFATGGIPAGINLPNHDEVC